MAAGLLYLMVNLISDKMVTSFFSWVLIPVSGNIHTSGFCCLIVLDQLCSQKHIHRLSVFQGKPLIHRPFWHFEETFM